jgi:hypothetical protein
MGTSTDKESVLDVLSRLKTELKFDAESFEGSEPVGGESSKKSAAVPAVAAVKEPKPPTVAVQEQSPAETVEELSNYMGNLLKRYGKGAATPEHVEPTPAEEAKKAAESHLPQRKPKVSEGQFAIPIDLPPVSNDPDAAPTEVVPGEFCLLEQRDFIPRKRAPEEKACMDAMRELAVHSARKAIQVCDNRKRGFEAKHRLMLGFGAFATSGIAFVFADAPFSLLGWVAMCGVAVGCMFLVNWQATVALVKKSNNS